MSYPSSRLDNTPELIPDQGFCVTQIIGLWWGRKIACYIRDHNINRWAHSKHSCLRLIQRVYVYVFPTFSKRKYLIESALPDNLSLTLYGVAKLYKFIPYSRQVENKVIHISIFTLSAFALTYFIDLIRKVIVRNLPALSFITPSGIDYSHAKHPLLNQSQMKSLIYDLASIPAEQLHQIFTTSLNFNFFIDLLQNFINTNSSALTQPVFIRHIIQVLHGIEKNADLTQDLSHPFKIFLNSFSSLKQQILTKIFDNEELVIPSTGNTVFYTMASYLIYTHPNTNIDLCEICFSYIKNNKLNCIEIKGIIIRNQTRLSRPVIKNIIQLIDKIDAEASLLQKRKDSKYENLLSFNLNLEESLLTFIPDDYSKELKIMQWIKNRINTANITYYLSMYGLRPNITLSIACADYLEKNKPLQKDCQEFLAKRPGNALSILSAGCLAKNDLAIKTIWEIIYLNKSFSIFKADKELLSSLGYLINKKEFSNQILLVGDLQNPQEVLVSREILSQRNHYFHALFQTSFLEGAQTAITLKDQDQTKLQDIDYEGFLYLLHYIYTGDVDVPLDLCLKVSHLADLYLEPDLKKTCDKKKWNQATLALKNKNLTEKFQSSRCKEFFCLVHEVYAGKTAITLKDLPIENLQGFSYQAILYLLHYIYTNDEDVPLDLCSDVSCLAEHYSEPDLKKACLKKT